MKPCCSLIQVNFYIIIFYDTRFSFGLFYYKKPILKTIKNIYLKNKNKKWEEASFPAPLICGVSSPCCFSLHLHKHSRLRDLIVVLFLLPIITQIVIRSPQNRRHFLVCTCVSFRLIDFFSTTWVHPLRIISNQSESSTYYAFQRPDCVSRLPTVHYYNLRKVFYLFIYSASAHGIELDRFHPASSWRSPYSTWLNIQ